MTYIQHIIQTFLLLLLILFGSAQALALPSDWLEIQIPAYEHKIETEASYQAVAAGTSAAVEWSATKYPDQTAAVLGVLEATGNAIDATVTYVDDATGNEVSKRWNEIPEHTRNQIKGGAKIASIFVLAGSIKALKQLKTAKKLPDAPEAKLTGTQEPITDPSRLLDNPARNQRTGELDPNYRAPEHPYAPIESFSAPEGTRVQMAVDESFQIDPATGQTINPSNFTTRGNITSTRQVRDDLAVKEEFKENITHVQEFEIKPGTQVQESTVSPQINPDGSVLQGGGNQIQILRQPGQRNSDVLILVGNPRPVKR